MSIKWTRGRNDCQEFYHPAGNRRIQVVRNLDRSHWVVYDLRDGGTCLLPNPYEARAQLRFREITALPACGEKFGSQPHTDYIGPPSPNYAWDTAEAAMRHVEETLL